MKTELQAFPISSGAASLRGGNAGAALVGLDASGFDGAPITPVGTEPVAKRFGIVVARLVALLDRGWTAKVKWLARMLMESKRRFGS
jgi:hypothetical protein